MKKRLFFQNIYAMGISLLISILILVCAINIFITIFDMQFNGNIISAHTVLIKDNQITYSTADFSSFDKQSLLMSIKVNEDSFKYNSINYSLTYNNFKDGTMIVQMLPKINSNRIHLYIFLMEIVLLIIIFIIVSEFLSNKNDKEIIKPLNDLTKQTEALLKGDFNVNIPDEGYNEINILGKKIEELRIRLKKEIYINNKAADNRKFLISSMSHDLRTPVTSIKGYLEGIIDGVANTKEKQELYIKKSLEKADLINQMISDLLLYSKLDLNQVDFKYQMIPIADYLKAYVEEAKVIYAPKNCKIYFTNETKTNFSVKIDVQQFDRVINNITENALKYIPENSGIVKVFLRENVNSIIIEFKDNGSGIAKEDVPKIFDRFYRCEKSRQIKGSSGLGLAISKQIIENMGGQIWAVSEPNIGTSIMISLKKTSIGDI